MPKKIPVTVLVLTYNEELNIEKCLKSLSGWIDEIIILDSNSTDSTINIVKNYTKNIYYHDFETHAKQWNWAMKNIEINNEWVLGLDSDQSVSPGLKDKLTELFSNDLMDTKGFYVRRKQIFLGQWIRHGGYYPKYLLKLFKKQNVRIDDKELVDHHFYIDGKTKIIENDIVEENIKENNLTFWFGKHLKYADLIAKESLNNNKKNPNIIVDGPDGHTMRMKKMYNSLPLFLRPFLYFIWRYIFQFGFLDGTRGLIFHFLQAFCFRFLIDSIIFSKKITKNNK